MNIKQAHFFEGFKKTTYAETAGKTFFLVLALLITISGCVSKGGDLSENNTATTQPNIVIIFLDDADYGDFSPFWPTRYETPNVARLAEEGRTFTSFYVPQADCSDLRRELMTGTYPQRNVLFEAY